MHRLIISIGFVLFLSTGLIAQETRDFNTINSETYRLYVEQKWDSLMVLGKEALKQDIDYYYLRMRIGIACYMQKNYIKAAAHFTEALSMNQGDPVALEYLYYSRLLSGKKAEASLIQKQFIGDLALKLPIPKGKFFERIGGEYLFSSGLSEEVAEKMAANPSEFFPESAYGMQSATRQFSNAAFSLASSIVPGFSLALAYTYLTKENVYFYNDGTIRFTMNDQQVYQHQFYVSPHFTFLSGFSFAPVLHVLNVHYQAPSLISQGGQGGGSTFELVTLQTNDFIAGLGLRKTIGSVDLHVGGYYSNLNDAQQVQGGPGLTWFPMGNLNLYAGGYLNSQYEVSSGKGVIRLIPELLFGFAISEKVWLDLNAAMGEMKNYHENNGTVVYNSFSELIDKRVKFTISVPVTPRGSLVYLGGRWTANRSEFYSFETDSPDQNTIKYNTLSIYGGLSWKF